MATPPQPDRMSFLEYFQDLGQHPLAVGDLIWFERTPFFYYGFPFHDIHPEDSIPLRALFRNPRVLAARYGQRPGVASPDRSVLWIRRRPYAIEDLSSNTRSKIRRGLKNTQIDRIDFAELRNHGFPLIESTASRQGVAIHRRHRSSWNRTCSVSQRFPVIEAWGGFVGKALAVFSICFQVEDCFQIWMLRSDSSQLGKYPNNALLHTLMDEAFRRPGVSAVCYGFASLDRGTSGLNDFKLSVGFDAEPVDDVVVGRLPILGVRAGAAALERVSRRRHDLAQAATVAKTARWWRRQPSTIASCHDG